MFINKSKSEDINCLYSDECLLQAGVQALSRVSNEVEPDGLHGRSDPQISHPLLGVCGDPWQR